MLESKRVPVPQRADYVLPLAPADAQRVRARLEELQRLPTWPVERWTRPKGRRGGPAAQERTIDVKPMIAGLAVEDDRLRWSAVPRATPGPGPPTY